MIARITARGLSVELTAGEATELLEQIGSISAKGRLKVRQLHADMQTALAMRDRIESGHDRFAPAERAAHLLAAEHALTPTAEPHNLRERGGFLRHRGEERDSAMLLAAAEEIERLRTVVRNLRASASKETP